MPKPPLSPSTPPESGPRPLEHASATADEGFNEVFGPDSPTAAVLPSGDATAGASRNELDCRDTLEEEAREEAGKKGEKAVAPEHPCPYSAFSSREKALIVVLVSTAAIFSPLSANIYVPALPLLSEQFNVPTESINLTITLYLVFQALSPAWWGSLADAMGRRPIYLTTLTLYVLACASLAVIPTSAFWPLLVLRMVQAIGGASVIALGSGVVGDIADRKERGSYMGYYGMGSMLGPTLGPTIGGLLAEGLGWRSIFWFLVIATMLCLVPLAFFLPETLRTIVADGSVPPPALNRRFIDFFGSQERKRVSPRADVPPTLSFHERWKSFRPLESYRLLFEPDLLFLLFYVALIYAEFYMVLTSTSTFLKSLYGFSEIKIGLFYLANGGGALVSSLVTGKILDWDYGRVLRSLPPNLPPKDYPLEKARLKQLPLYCLIFHICCIGFGWAMESRAHIAVVVILQFGIGWCGTAAMTVAQSTSVDLFPSKGASVTASLNLLRCLLGAVATSIVEPMIKRINAGWTFVVMSLICVSFSWMPMLNLKRGPAWREGRRLRENEREKQQREKAAAAVASEMQEPAV